MILCFYVISSNDIFQFYYPFFVNISVEVYKMNIYTAAIIHTFVKTVYPTRFFFSILETNSYRVGSNLENIQNLRFI